MLKKFLEIIIKSFFIQAHLTESSQTKVPPAEASGGPSPVQEKTVVKTTSSSIGAAGHGINGNSMQKKSPKELKRAIMAEDVHILDSSKEGNVGRFINVKGRKQRLKYIFYVLKQSQANL